MTSPAPYTREELVELAALDALGLLDDYEAAHYTRSLLDAPATVQDEIRELQAQIAADQDLLPVEEPEAALRQQVLGAVARALDEEASMFAPLATIGRNRARGEAGGGRGLGPSGQFWRAAAFVLAGVGVVMAYFWSEVQRQSNRIAELALSNLTDHALATLVGPPVTEFLGDATATRVVLVAAREGSGAWANAIVREDGMGFLIFEKLPWSQDSEYALQVTLADGTSHTIRRFDSVSGAGIGGIVFDTAGLAVSTLGTATWEVVTRSGVAILTS
jgi:hypothetical protein